MDMQTLLSDLKIKNQEFIAYGANFEYSDKNCMALFANIIKKLENITTNLEQAILQINTESHEKTTEEKWVINQNNYYNKLFLLAKQVLNNVKLDFKKSSEIPRFVQLIKLLSKFELKKQDVLDRLENKELSTKDEFENLYSNYNGINLLYQNLSKIEEKILIEESLENVQETMESLPQKEEVNLLDLIVENTPVVKPEITSSVPTSKLENTREVKQSDIPTLLKSQETESFASQTFVDERQKKRIAYLNALAVGLYECNKIKDEMLVNPQKPIEFYNEAMQFREIIIKEMSRLKEMTIEQLERMTDEELNLPSATMDFETVLKCRMAGQNLTKYQEFIQPVLARSEEKQLHISSSSTQPPIEEIQFREPELRKSLRNSVATYESLTGHKMFLSINGQDIIIKHQERNSEKPVSNQVELAQFQEVRKAIKEYEAITGKKMDIKIEERKPKKAGKLFKVLRKAEASVVQKFHQKRKLCYTAVIAAFASALGIGLPNIINAANKYDFITIESEEKTKNLELSIQTNREKEVTTALNILETNANLIQDFSNVEKEVELPFHINQSTFSLLPGTMVYTDEYLGRDGNDTARNPLYPTETPRIPEDAIIRNLETGEIMRVYSDEAMLEAMKNNWEVVGTHAFDGFYELAKMNIEKERGMSR